MGYICRYLIIEHKPLVFCGYVFQVFFPNFSSIRFSVSGFKWRSLIHLDLSFVEGDKNGSIVFSYMFTISWTKHNFFFENVFLFPLDEFSSCVKDPVIIGVWVHLWVFSSKHWSTCPSLYQYHEVFITIALKNSLRSGMVIPQKLFLLLKIVFAIMGFVLLFEINLEMALSKSMKNWVEIFMEILLNL